MEETEELCAHCGNPLPVSVGTTSAGKRVCHTGSLPPWKQPLDCYRLVTTYGQELGKPDGPVKRIV